MPQRRQAVTQKRETLLHSTPVPAALTLSPGTGAYAHPKRY